MKAKRDRVAERDDGGCVNQTQKSFQSCVRVIFARRATVVVKRTTRDATVHMRTNWRESPSDLRP